MLALRRIVAARGHVAAVLGARGVKITRRPPLSRLPEHLRRPRQHRRARAARAARAGTSSRCARSGCGDAVRRRASTCSTSAAARTASRRSSPPTSSAKAEALREAVAGGAAFLAVCGGYQLLGRFYRDLAGDELPGIGLLPLHTVAGERRMIGDVLLDCAWAGETLAGFENHAGRTLLDDGAEPLGRVRRGLRQRRRVRATRAAAQGRVYGTYLHGPLLPRNPWFADRLLADALAHAPAARPSSSRSPDELERAAHARLRRARPRARRPLVGSGSWISPSAHFASTSSRTSLRAGRSPTRATWSTRRASPRRRRGRSPSMTGRACFPRASPRRASTSSRSRTRRRGERVGDLWFAERDSDFGDKAAFIYSIEIFEEFRGRGLGRQAMLALEDEVRRRGLSRIALNVFGGNDVARSLYRSVGYAETAVFMSKEL